MSTDASTIDYLIEQAMLGPRLTTRRMFGEYALYVDTKVVAFVCDNQVFLKPNDPARPHMVVIDEQPPYPGAKMYWRLGEEIDDRDRFRRLLDATAKFLPLPKPKGTKPTAPASKASPAKSPRANASTTLEEARNLGPKSLVMLSNAGVKTMAKLRALGAVTAYVKVKRKNASASLNLLWALEGALTDTSWQTVTSESRERLLLELDSVMNGMKK
jgi:TfoX/Sxy family transcriptional regulator of competence genes